MSTQYLTDDELDGGEQHCLACGSFGVEPDGTCRACRRPFDRVFSDLVDALLEVACRVGSLDEAREVAHRALENYREGF